MNQIINWIAFYTILILTLSVRCEDIEYPGYWSIIDDISEKPPDQIMQFLYAVIEKACDKEDRTRKSKDLFYALLKIINGDFEPEEIAEKGKPGKKERSKMISRKNKEELNVHFDEGFAKNFILEKHNTKGLPPAGWANY